METLMVAHPDGDGGFVNPKLINAKAFPGMQKLGFVAVEVEGDAALKAVDGPDVGAVDPVVIQKAKAAKAAQEQFATGVRPDADRAGEDEGAAAREAAREARRAERRASRKKPTAKTPNTPDNKTETDGNA